MDIQEHHEHGAQARFFDDAVARIRDAGMKLTTQRVAILRHFEEQFDHMTAQAIYEALDGQLDSLSLATVYNSLELFEEMAIVQRLRGRDGQAYFDPNTSPHHHGICTSCEEIFDIAVAAPSVESMVGQCVSIEDEERDFQVTSATVLFRGICSGCK